MYGPQLLADFLSVPSNEPDKYGNFWQYNSRSDRHSKVGCWGVAFDLLSESALFRKHATQGKVVIGVNHSMVDFQNNRSKKLDLVIARPAESTPSSTLTFKSLMENYGIHLNADATALLGKLPDIQVADVGAVLVALEAKAVMTAHQKALPRLYDELNSSHLCVHGASNQALAIAFVQINASKQFASSTKNSFSLATRKPEMNTHNQPRAVEIVLDKIRQLPRRTGTTGNGYDGIGASVFDFENAGGAVNLVEKPPAPSLADIFNYDSMIVRMAHEYDSRFHSI